MREAKKFNLSCFLHLTSYSWLVAPFLAVFFLFHPFPLFCSSYTVQTNDKFFFPFQNGFPIEADGYLYSSVVFSDVDNDGQMELAFKSGGTFVFNHDGTILNGSWPINYGSRSPTLADFNKDGELEIVTVDIEINVWKIDGTLVNGWPYIFTEGVSHSCPPAVDLDGDEFPEVCSSYDQMNKYFTIVDNNGSALPGYPIQVEDQILDSPAVVDIDNNGIFEIAIGHFGYSHEKIIVFDLSGNIFNGDWIVDLDAAGLGGLISDITIGDIDDDLRPEIMFATDYDPGGNGFRHVVILNHDRSFATGWPKIVWSYVYGGLSVGDIDGDGALEVACVTSAEAEGSGPYLSRLYVWNGEDGSDLPGWPLDIEGWQFSNSNVIIGDIDGDCDRELVVAGYKKLSKITEVYAWHHDGSLVKGFPLQINGFISEGSNSCFLTDIDNDGDVEIGIGVHNDSTPEKSRVYVWDLPGAYRPKCPPDWPQYNHDAQHTGNYHHPDGLPILNVPSLSIAGVLVLLLLLSLLQLFAFCSGRKGHNVRGVQKK